MSGKVDCDVSVERVTDAELWVVSAAFVDYYQFMGQRRRHRFAFIKRKSFSKEGYEEIINTLRQRLLCNERVNLIIEKRKNPKTKHLEDYLIRLG